MDSERAPDHKPDGEPAPLPRRGELLSFPDRRSFGPFSWRTIRIATLAVLLLMALGALVQLFLTHALRESSAVQSRASRAPS